MAITAGVMEKITEQLNEIHSAQSNLQALLARYQAGVVEAGVPLTTEQVDSIETKSKEEFVRLRDAVSVIANELGLT